MSVAFFSITESTQAEDFLRRIEAERSDPGGEQSVEATVTEILASVKKRGLDAVVEYTRRFDASDFTAGQFRVSEQALAGAANGIHSEDKAVIADAIANIRTFHEAQKERSWFLTRDDGSIFGQRVVPVDRAGLYVPAGQGGLTPLISSLLMGAIPAQVAGVREIAVVSPPRKDGSVNEHILAAAHMLGIREVYAAGSAWGVAALAYGAEPLKAVDVIAGPGNIFVTTAKRLLIGTVGIDMIAGPSEVCIITDETAKPAWIAADMLSQAEHDSLASSICLCTDASVAQAVVGELERQCGLLPRKDIARQSLERFGAIITVPCLETAVAVANRIAPEHLELLVAEPWAVLPGIRHAGAVFMGYNSAEPLGDYYAGPNHVLPTMGTARFSSALSVDTFCKKMSIVAASGAFAASGAGAVARLARLEGLEAHARSALCRLEKE